MSANPPTGQTPRTADVLMPESLCTMAGHYSLGIICNGFSLESALRNTTKMNKESIELGRLYRVRELVNICDVNYRTELIWIKLGEIDSIKTARTVS